MTTKARRTQRKRRCLLRRRWDARPRRSAPVLGRSSVKRPKALGKLECGGTLRACCARGRAHSAVTYPAVLAVTSDVTAGTDAENAPSGHPVNVPPMLLQANQGQPNDKRQSDDPARFPAPPDKLFRLYMSNPCVKLSKPHGTAHEC